jgi:hypothetical protein
MTLSLTDRLTVSNKAQSAPESKTVGKTTNFNYCGPIAAERYPVFLYDLPNIYFVSPDIAGYLRRPLNHPLDFSMTDLCL